MKRDELFDKAIREWHSQPEDVSADEQRAIKHGIEVALSSIDRRSIVEAAFADVEADLIRYGRYSLASEIRKVMDAVLAEYEGEEK